MTDTALQVIHPLTGEVLDLRDASTERLVQGIAGLREAREHLSEFEALASDELARRCDMAATWTLRIDGYEVKVPSPTAGTESYPSDMLEAELRGLVKDGTITEEAAGKALKRQVTLTLDVPLSLSLADVRRWLGPMTITLVHTDIELQVADVSSSSKPSAAGINALRKVPGTSEALDRALKVAPAGRRRATVKAV